MEIQTAVYTTIIITVFMAIVLVIINRQLVKFDPLSEPKGIVLLVIMFEQYVEKLVKDKTNDDVSKYLTPYIMTVAAYIFLANIAGLFSLESPTSNYSVTLALAAITCVLIEVYSF